MDAERMWLTQNENKLFLSLLIECLGYQIKPKPWFETPLEDQLLIECWLLLMKEGHLFWCCIYVKKKKKKSSFIQAVTIQGMQPQSSWDVCGCRMPRSHGTWRIQAECGISHRAQHISPVMLLLGFFTENLPLRTGVLCHVYSQERPDPPGDSSVQCMWRMNNWLALNSPFIRANFSPRWLCCPFTSAWAR